nr:molybdopterin-dependent oxidoreductase [Desulfopila inferna]
MVVIDPRKSETASIADIHLPLHPGTDALLIKAMIAIILKRGWEHTSYLENHVEGFAKIRPWFSGMDIEAAIFVCKLDYDQVVELCRLMTTKRWCMHPDLGIYMGRHSTLNSYLLNILGAICGIFGVRGGNLIPGMVMPLGFHADERNPKTWRTVATNMPPAAGGSFPPAVVPEEIEHQHPERLRTLYVNGCNPLRSYPDTTAYEEAFKKLDLLVVCDIVMSETARYAITFCPAGMHMNPGMGHFSPGRIPRSISRCGNLL